MSTRSQLIIQTDIGDKPLFLWHRFDGYPSNILPILKKAYDGYENVHFKDISKNNKVGSVSAITKAVLDADGTYQIQGDNDIVWADSYIYILTAKNGQWNVDVAVPAWYDEFTINGKYDINRAKKFDYDSVTLDDFKIIWSGNIKNMTKEKAKEIERMDTSGKKVCKRCGKVLLNQDD